MIGGDLLLGRGVAADAARRGWPAQLLAQGPRLRAADLSIVNLESPLAPCLPGGTVARPRLCGDPAGVEALAKAGVGAVTLANNHALDAGPDGLRKTVDLLARRGIRSFGTRAALTGLLEAERVGPLQVVAANLTPPSHPPGSKVPLPSPAALSRAVARARRLAPSRPVLVILHVGRELDPLPNPRDRAYAEAAVGGGAAAVVMHGAHVRRAHGRDRGVPVHLGLGNLRFDQRDPRARVGALLTLGLRPGKAPGSQGSVEVEEFCIDSLSGVEIPCPGGGPSRP